MHPLVSVIIPCYNHGIYLEDAIGSIPFNQVSYKIELIVVNDGSTDSFTLEKLAALESAGICIIHQENQGLSAARNKGISVAKGKYILPLDSDNKLHINYLTKAVDLLEKSELLDIVYGNRMLFGKEEGLWKSKPFRPDLFVAGNFIDACAIYRKSVWEKVGGYDTNMKVGHEDWEFWVHAYTKGCSFHYLNEPCYYYRIREGSMRQGISSLDYENNRQYVLKKHAEYFATFFQKNYFLTHYLKAQPIKAAINLLLGRIKI